MHHYLQPNWPAPKNIKAYTTLRMDGYSTSPYDSFNLAAHVGDDIEAVNKNRAKLAAELQLPNPPFWLEQAHTTTAIRIDKNNTAATPCADASYTTTPGIVCAVLTADCLPILLCDRNATVVAAIHAGWKGLAAGIIEATLRTMLSDLKLKNIDAANLLAWLGPAIGPKAFEVGPDVRAIFLRDHPEAEQAFKAISPNKWLANMYLLARQRLNSYGIKNINIYGGDYCTYSDPQRFYSFRRDHGVTGRMASLVWME